MNAATFRKKAVAASEKTGVSVDFYDGEKLGSRAYEDDGCLHVSRAGLRACFDVDKGLDNGAAQNAATRVVLAALGIEVTDNALVDEDDGEGDYCEHCGRGSR